MNSLYIIDNYAQKNLEGQIVITSGGMNLMNGNSPFVVDPNNLTECKVKNMPISALFGSGIFASDHEASEGYSMICGGCIEDCSKNSFQHIDENELKSHQISKHCFRLAKDGSWHAGPNLRERRMSFTLTRISNNSIISIGGLNGENDRGTNTVEIMHRNQWNPVDVAPVKIHGHCTVEDNKNNLIILGGVQNGRVCNRLSFNPY